METGKAPSGQVILKDNNFGLLLKSLQVCKQCYLVKLYKPAIENVLKLGSVCFPKGNAIP